MKRKKYQAECDARGIDFVPFVVTTDGAMGLSAQLLVTRLAQKLKAKWEAARRRGARLDQGSAGDGHRARIERVHPRMPPAADGRG